MLPILSANFVGLAAGGAFVSGMGLATGSGLVFASFVVSTCGNCFLSGVIKERFSTLGTELSLITVGTALLVIFGAESSC